MTANMGTADRLIRLIAGLALVILPFATTMSIWSNPAVKYIAVIVGVVFVLTSLIRFCPLYTLLGIKTSKA